MYIYIYIYIYIYVCIYMYTYIHISARTCIYNAVQMAKVMLKQANYEEDGDGDQEGFDERMG